jgi:hypothetical protein
MSKFQKPFSKREKASSQRQMLLSQRQNPLSPWPTLDGLSKKPFSQPRRPHAVSKKPSS